MKKSELKATLGSIRASDELVRRTVLEAEERKHKKEHRPALFNMSFGMRLAGAACALMLTVGVMSAVLANRTPLSTPDSGAQTQEGIQKAKEMSIVCADADSSESQDSISDPIEALRTDAESCTGEWAIIEGSISYASAQSNSEEGRYALEIKISAERVVHTSDGASVIAESVDAVAVFSDEEHRQRMIDSIGDTSLLLIEKNPDGVWKVAKIIY